MVRHGPLENVAHRVQVGTAMVIHHALGLASGAGGVVQRNRLPLVAGQPVGVIRVALGQQRLVLQLANALGLAQKFRVGHIDNQRLAFQLGNRRLNHLGKLRVYQNHLGFAVGQHIANGVGIEANIERIQHAARQRHAEVSLEHRGNIGQHGGHRLPRLNVALFQR